MNNKFTYAPSDLSMWLYKNKSELSISNGLKPVEQYHSDELKKSLVFLEENISSAKEAYDESKDRLNKLYIQKGKLMAAIESLK
jgi:hypothetical protein